MSRQKLRIPNQHRAQPKMTKAVKAVELEKFEKTNAARRWTIETVFRLAPFYLKWVIWIEKRINKLRLRLKKKELEKKLSNWIIGKIGLKIRAVTRRDTGDMHYEIWLLGTRRVVWSVNARREISEDEAQHGVQGETS